MVFGFSITETDNGTKERTRLALARTHGKLKREFIIAAQEYWYKVWVTARELCVVMGAFDTGTLYESIRLIWEIQPYGGLYEVAISSTGAEITAMIKAGGEEYINPKTGKSCNYAQAVHDGTKYMGSRPFLTMAIEMCEPMLDIIMKEHVDLALEGFKREY